MDLLISVPIVLNCILANTQAESGLSLLLKKYNLLFPKGTPSFVDMLTNCFSSSPTSFHTLFTHSVVKIYSLAVLSILNL